jgi:hypothetical protein
MNLSDTFKINQRPTSSWGCEEGSSKGLWRHALLVIADLTFSLKK